MSSEFLPRWHLSSQLPHRHAFRQCCLFLRPRNRILSAITILGLMYYAPFLTPHSPSLLRLSDWYCASQAYPHSPEPVNANVSLFTSTKPAFPTPVSTEESPRWPPYSESVVADELTLEQIRDIVAPTRGFYSCDYSLYLGWNNMRYIIDAALLQAELLNRTLVIPSFVYARACEYNITVCADYAPMVNRGDALGLDTWRSLPMEEQMGFRIPISVMLDLPRLRARRPVMTVSEYLRLHGQTGEIESTDGFWRRESYHTHINVFEPNRTKTPSLFVIENHWYDPQGTTRVDYIPEEMRTRANLTREEEPTEISKLLWKETTEWSVVVEWELAKDALRLSGLVPEEDLNDDAVFEGILNANGWEVLYTFAHFGIEMAKAVVLPIKQIAPRSSIRGFKDDYNDVDADVIMIAGEVHLARKPGTMRFTNDLARDRFASMVIHYSNTPPQPVLDLAEVLAIRMRELTGGRLWMGAHVRRGDFVELGWAMGIAIEDHMNRVMNQLEAGRSILEHLGNPIAYDFEGVEPNPELSTLSPPLPHDPFYVATDERDPHAVEVIRNAGGVFLSDLLTMEDRRKYGWPLLLTDVRALIEQNVLAHSAYFYGHVVSSFAGVIVNQRAALGADRRTGFLD